jgi:hypothetical protein
VFLPFCFVFIFVLRTNCSFDASHPTSGLISERLLRKLYQYKNRRARRESHC